MIKYLQRRYALSRKGAIDNIKGILCCALQNISFMLPVGLLYRLVSDMMNGTLTTGRIPFYVIGCVAAALFIVVCTRLEYDNTFLVTYVESGVRRVGLAEKLRKIPLSFFGRKDLADLTSSIMNDCAMLEQSQSHFVAPLYGAILSTTVIAVSMLFFNWRMALAAVWPLPVAFAIVLLASDVQKKLSRKATAAKVACEDGIQECLEAMPDLRANNAEERYLSGLEKKIRAVESRLVRSELGTAIFVVSAGLVLRLGIATTALAGAALLVKGELDVLTFFMFLLVVSRLYDPLEGTLQNLAAIIGTNSNIERMNEILDCHVQTGSEQLTNRNCDIVFDHVGFSYQSGETVLRDVSFTAKQGEVTALVGPSGGGKTTVSRLAARFWDIDRGRITVGGMDISGIDPEKLMSLYSIVFQDVTLFDNTILENIRIGRKDATDEEVIAAAKLANADEFIRMLPDGYNTMLTANGGNLSQGQRQLIAIARAAVADPPVMILDEATSSIDTRTEAIVQKGMDALMKGRTVFVIAHRLSTIQNSDVIMVLEHGRIIERGNHDDLIAAQGRYYQLYTGSFDKEE